MDVNNLLALLFVNAVFELSTSFLFHLIPSNLDCFGHTCLNHHSGGSESGHVHANDDFVYCEIGKNTNGGLLGLCGVNTHIDMMCPQHGHSKCRCYDQKCINSVSERYEQQQQLYRMTYACLTENCHGTEHCQIKKEIDGEIVSSCTSHVPHIDEYCINHDSITSHGCYCDTADCVQKTALHCLGVTCNPSEGCEIYRQNGQIAAKCYSCDDNCIHRCHKTLNLDHQHLPCVCNSQTCADRIVIPTVTTHVQTTAVPALQQLDPYLCVAANCDKYERFCHLFEANNNVEGRCMVIEVGQLCSPANDLSVHGGCYCSNLKCVSNAITDYNQKHTTAATLAPGYMCNKELCRSDTYCPIVNYNGVATSRCIVFKATQSCQTYKDVDGAGCTCDNTNCSINILNEFSLHNLGTRTCHVCGEITFQIPCSNGQIGRDLPQTCKTGEDYCMTDIVQDAQGNVDVFKRCVDLATCENKWYTESAGLDYCKHYGVVKNPDNYSCHFCCTEDKCNSMLVPNATTWYTKTN